MARKRNKDWNWPGLGAPIEPGPQLERMLKNEPEHVVFPLDYFIAKFGFEAEDIRLELAAGRLVAETNEAGLRAIRRGKMPEMVVITYKAVRAWLFNPQTPQHLLDKIMQGPIKLH